MRLVQEDVSQALIDAVKNRVAMDGLWFQAVEQACGMDTALALDMDVWEQFAVIEAQRIKERLALPENGGLDALEIAFNNRLVSLLNKLEILRPDENTFIVKQKHATCSPPERERGWHGSPVSQSEWSNSPFLPAPLMPG